MSLVFSLVFIVSMLVLGLRAGIGIRNRIVHGHSTKEIKSLSSAARQLLVEYRKMPADLRPNVDMFDIVAALDIKYGVGHVTRHFSETVYNGGTVFSWNCRTHAGPCSRYPEYVNIKNEMDALRQAKADQEHALKMSGAAHGLAEAQNMIDWLRQERELVNEVTKELT